MPDARTCPSCGSELPARAPEGLCPRCLLRAGLSSDALSVGRPGEVGATISLDGSGGVLETIAASLGPVPRILLRDTDAGPEPPLVRPGREAGADDSTRYRIDGEIARGGMGAVLKGRDPDLGRDVAIKVLREELLGNPDMVRRFVEEAQIGGQLQHPGIVPIYELGAFADRRPFFSMKLVKGHTLAALLDARKDPASELPRLLNIVEAIAQTVAYAHARGVIHRDLKPSNVMVGSFGEVQVMDWGLAKVLPRGGVADDASAGKAPRDETVIATARSGSGDSDLSHAGSVLGTPSYMAPEQARGEIDRVDERADVFALGSILCEVLTGRPAFVGRSSGEIQRNAAAGDTAEALARLDGSGADAELIALARDCLAREPDDRPREAGAVSGRLTAYLSGVQERLRSAERERAVAEAKAVEERKRRRLTVALAASLLATMALGGLGGAYLLQQRQARLAAADRALVEATTLLGPARARPEDPAGWRSALAAAGRVDPAGLPAGARTRLDALARDALAGAEAAEADRDLLDKVVDIRASRAYDDGSATDLAYSAAFRAAGYDVDALGAEAVAAKIHSRPAATALALAAALDDWAYARRIGRPKDEAGWGRPAAAARAVDPDPRRDEVRRLWAAADPRAQLGPLRDLAARADVATLPAPTLLLLASALYEAGDSDAGAALLRRAVVTNPGDVWINFQLASLLEHSRPPRKDEALRYYAAARALRPETADGLADALLDRGETDEAIAILRELTRLRPKNLGNHLRLSAALRFKAGRPDEGLAVLDAAAASAREAVRLRPDDAEAHAILARALASQGKPAEALAEEREAVRLRPQSVPGNINLGIALGQQGKFAEAEAQLREAIRMRPEEGILHHVLGDVLLREGGKDDEALAELREAIRAGVDAHGMTYFDIGVVMGRRGKLDEAAASYREAIRIEPDQASTHDYLASVLKRQGKLGEAEASYREAIRLEPGLPAALYGLADVLMAQGKLGEAEAAIREAIRHWPEYAEAHALLGNALAEQGKFAEAAAAWREAIRLQPTLGVVHANLGAVLTRQGKLGEAVAAAREAIRLKPDDAQPHAVLGRALRSQQKFGEAVAEMREAVRLKPDDAKAHSELAFTLRESGDLDAAMRSVGDALRLDPELVTAQVILAKLLVLRGRFSEAVPALERAATRIKATGIRDQAAVAEVLVPRVRWLVGRAAALEALAASAPPGRGEATALDLAARARERGRPALAARLYEVALIASPARADDLDAGHRSAAARVAALAGSGGGQDDPRPDDGERAELRRLALDWLKADLAARSKRLKADPKAGPDVRKALQTWREEIDLAGVRDPGALDKRPESERKDWQALWAEVDALLKKAEK